MAAILDKSAVLKSLRELDRNDPHRRVFGSQVHQFRLNPPLERHIIEDFESRFGVAVPDDYRYFITEIGNGGAGPYYGLFPFGMHDGGMDELVKWEDGHLIGDVSQPFAFSDAWNLPTSFWERAPNPGPNICVEEEDRWMEEWDKELESHYWTSIMNGAIPICHIGCALRQWLVIHGAQKGYVWSDNRADEAGVEPLIDEHGKRVTFTEWYLSWLQNPLRI